MFIFNNGRRTFKLTRVIKKKARENKTLKYNTDDEYKKNKLEYNENLRKNNPELFKKYKRNSTKHTQIILINITQYNKTNRDKILNSVGEKILCDCCEKSIRKNYFHNI